MRPKDLQPIPLCEGETPPSTSLETIYPSDSHSRRCVKCNKLHDFGIFNTRTGERIEDFDLCPECWWEKQERKTEDKMETK